MSENICEKCKNLYREDNTCMFFCDKATPHSLCVGFAQITNADHIRSMTDEEIAEKLGGSIHVFGFRCKICSDDGCKKCILDWLKQPYEEG